VNVVDSSGWLEFFAKGDNAELFAEPIGDLEHLVVPTISVYEVFKRIALDSGEAQAKRHITLMNQGRVVDLNAQLAMQAAWLSVEMSLPMADSIMLTTARAYDAMLWTQDSDFEGVEDVRYFAKRT